MIASSLSKNNIQQVFQKLHVLLKEEFSPEDIQIIACPSMEQVTAVRRPCCHHGLSVVFVSDVFEFPCF